MPCQSSRGPSGLYVEILILNDSTFACLFIVLIAIIGICNFFPQVFVRHMKSGKETRHDLMVMENLTFGRNITRQYDLKGALHARYNTTASNPGDVLLDQNFVNDMNSSPLYVSNKAKRILERAVWNDTTFLNVSLLQLVLQITGTAIERCCFI